MQFSTAAASSFALLGMLASLAGASPVAAPAVADGTAELAKRSATWTINIFSGQDCNGPRVYSSTQTGSATCINLTGNAGTGNHATLFANGGTAGATLYADANCQNPIHNIASPQSCYTTLVNIKSYAVIA